MHRDQPVLKNALRRRPLKRPQRAPGQSAAISSWVNSARCNRIARHGRSASALPVHHFLAMVVLPFPLAARIGRLLLNTEN
jgi:hypothetical protein